MQLQRNEIMTGVLVVGTVAVLVFILILLGAPRLFRPLVTYKMYFANAAGSKVGAAFWWGGRKTGQVRKWFSPASPKKEKSPQEAEAAIPPPQPNASPTPAENKPRFEVRVVVQVDKSARVYRDAK